MRASLVAALIASIVGFSAHTLAQASIRRATAIPPQALAPALRTLMKDREFQIVYSSELVGNRRTQGAQGELTMDEALTQILSGTGLTYRYIDDKTITIAPTPSGRDASSGSAGEGSATASKASEDSSKDAHSQEGDQSKSFWDRFRLAQVDQGVSSGAAPVEKRSQQPSKEKPAELVEVLVTAQKREERLLDVPMSLTALSGEQLVSSQSTRFEDYVGKVPGLALLNNGPVGGNLVIRGITSGVDGVNSSVATYIDETPYTAPGLWAGSALVAPNLDTFDMQRIEVLKGPQGTLYGANALGGLLKFVTNAPDPSGFKATVETGGGTLDKGGTGFDTHALVNVPITSAAALRIVGYDNYYPGYIDDPSRHVTDINGSHFAGGRASLLYSPRPELAIRLNALYQKKSWGDWPNEDVNAGSLTPLYGSLTQQHLIGQPGRTTVQLYNVTIGWDAELAKLLSTTSYYENSTSNVYSYDQFAPIISAILGGAYGLEIGYSSSARAFTQELRLSSADSKPFQWQIGAYFTSLHGGEDEGYSPIDVGTRTLLSGFSPSLGFAHWPVSYREYAGFASLDYHVTGTLDVSGGGRYSENDQTFREVANGLLFGSQNFGTPSSQGVSTWSGAARWHVTPGSMLYARVASGFAPGGPNDVIPTAQLPRSYSSSTTVNYEAGLKSSLLENQLTVEVSAFHIDWHDIQLYATIGGFGALVNGGAARSDGVEWNFAYIPISGLTLNFNGAYTNASLRQATPPSAGGAIGDRLPGTPRWGGSASAAYDRSLVGGYAGFAGIDWRFTGSRYADFQPIGPRQQMPSFAIFDMRAGVRTQNWSLTLYVKNVGNKLAFNYLQPESLSGGLGPQSAVVYPPRTVGASLTATFR